MGGQWESGEEGGGAVRGWLFSVETEEGGKRRRNTAYGQCLHATQVRTMFPKCCHVGVGVLFRDIILEPPSLRLGFHGLRAGRVHKAM